MSGYTVNTNVAKRTKIANNRLLKCEKEINGKKQKGSPFGAYNSSNPQWRSYDDVR